MALDPKQIFLNCVGRNTKTSSSKQLLVSAVYSVPSFNYYGQPSLVYSVPTFFFLIINLFFIGVQFANIVFFFLVFLKNLFIYL